MLRNKLALGLILAFACSSAQSEDAPASQITDLKFLAVQSVDPTIRDNVDGAENKYKFVRVFFGTNIDLPALSNAQHRDVHISYYPCAFGYSRKDSYTYDPSAYDAYGEITHNRSSVKTDKLEKFKGLYYFFMPTDNMKYGKREPYVSAPPFDLYSEVQDMCFEIPGSTDDFFSNEVRIPADALQTVLAKRPH